MSDKQFHGNVILPGCAAAIIERRLNNDDNCVRLAPFVNKVVNPMQSVPPEAVATVFESYPPSIRKKLMVLRVLIFEVAAKTKGVGALEESLKWGEPAYVTSETRSGSTIRIAWKKARPTQYAMYFNCQTPLVDSFKTIFPGAFKFEANRALVFDESDEVPIAALRYCVELALTYHARKRARD